MSLYIQEMGGDQRTWPSANPESRIFSGFFLFGIRDVFFGIRDSGFLCPEISGFGIRDFCVLKVRDSGFGIRDSGHWCPELGIRDTGFGDTGVPNSGHWCPEFGILV